MIEPRNHTALIDRFGDTWIRVDEYPGRHGNWWPLTDGPNWDSWAQNGIGSGRTWEDVRDSGPFEVADADRTAKALARVIEEARR